MQIVNPPSPTCQTPHHSRPASVEKVDSYTLIPHMSSSKCASGAGSLHGNLLVCGGYDRGECLREVEIYSPRDNTWTMLPDMRQGRGRFDLTVLNEVAYAVGGCDGSRELNSVEKLDNETKKWINVSPLPLARSNTGKHLTEELLVLLPLSPCSRMRLKIRCNWLINLCFMY